MCFVANAFPCDVGDPKGTLNRSENFVVGFEGNLTW